MHIQICEFGFPKMYFIIESKEEEVRKKHIPSPQCINWGKEWLLSHSLNAE